MDTLGLHIPWPCCALLLESSPMVVASGVTLTSSPQPSRLRSVTRLPGVPTGTRPGPHWEPSPLSRVLSWVRRLPLHLLGAWQGSRGHRIHRLLRFSGGLLATVNLLATITPRCPPRPRESALSLDAVLCLWGRPPSSPLHLRFRGAPPSSPQSRAEQKTVLPPTGTLAQLCALPLPEPQEDSGGLGGGGLQTPFSPVHPKPCPPTVSFLFGFRQGPEGKGQRVGRAPLLLHRGCLGSSDLQMLGGSSPRLCPKTPIPLPQLAHLSGGPAPMWEGTDLGQRLLGKLSSSLGRLPSEWVTWTPSRPEHQGRSRWPFLEVGGSERLGRGSSPAPRASERPFPLCTL